MSDDAIEVRAYREGDMREVVRLYATMFPDADADDEVAVLARDAGRGLYVVARGDGTLGGFVEVGTRPYAEGCDSSPVGYVEAWYVEPALRRRGFGARLIAAAADWTRARGMSELASDALLDNAVSIDAHRALGFAEIERIVCFRKRL
jgi:aminoglycoside 6'-N-acetyltransferase I